VIGPVQTLIASARRIAQGDLASAVPRAGGGELAQLAGALEEMRVGLREAELARQDVDRLKDEFVSSVSHELRTPLGYIKGYATTLLRRDAHWDADTAREFLRIIDESSDQLGELVDHLLDMSRIAEGVLAVAPEPTRLAPLIDDVARWVRGRSAEHPVAVAVSAALPPAMADQGRVQQVLGNLIDNAVKYSPDGGAITITAVEEGEEIVVSVRDEGIGISEGMLEAVFDRFQRGHDLRVMKIRGVGLGLPICRGIVHAHGGRIWAEPAPGWGTIVRFSLPIARSDVEPEPTPAGSAVGA
jgi:two-component system sensor histidine kinase KdpD